MLEVLCAIGDREEWIVVEPESESGFRTLFFNPLTNLQHAKTNLLHQFLRDLQSLANGTIDEQREHLETLTSFKMVKAMATHFLRAYGDTSAQTASFRIAVTDGSGAREEAFLFEAAERES